MAEKYKFNKIEKNFAFLNDITVKSLLDKWNVDFGIHSFNYDKTADELDMPTVMKHFFEDDNVLKEIKVDPYVNNIEVEPLNTEIMSMDFFDRIKKNDSNHIIVRPNGSISGAPPELMKGIQIEDELRRCLLDEDSENYYLFDDEERAEFIFQLFTVTTIGGPLCQYENEIEPYFETTKTIYKDLVAIKKMPTGEKAIRSLVYEIKIEKKNSNSSEYYQPGGKVKSHPQTKTFFIVDPFYRHITILSHKWIDNKIW